MDYIPRYLEGAIVDAHKTFKVLYLGGPRQVGKTTLLTHIAARFGMGHVTFDDIRMRSLAKKDPELFLDQYPAPLLIDEVQYVPEIFSAIKMRVDKSEKMGRYWLTGSQQFSSLRYLQESLAGRVAILSLLGLSSAEIQRLPKRVAPFSLAAHSGKNSPPPMKDVFARILRGSFPVLWHDNAPSLELFYNSYIQTYIDRDLRDLFGVSKLTEFHTFLQLCAARTGQMLNYSELARDAGVSVHATREWVSILESTGHVYLLRPYFNNISKRLIKTPKLYFLDTGLAAYLTRWNTSDTLRYGAMAGAFFETHVVAEILKSYLFRGIQPTIFYYRDKQGHEVDVVLCEGQKQFLIEIKIAATITESDGAGIRYVAARNHAVSHSSVVCLSNERYALDRTIDVIPVGEIA